MTPKTRKALEASIKHWERNVTGRTTTISSEHCALCRLFLDAGCKGCPVSNYTGKDICRGTPYVEIARMDDKNENLNSLKFRSLAFKELRFLESLQPKGKP